MANATATARAKAKKQRPSSRELYTSGLESLLYLECQHAELHPLMTSLASSPKLKAYLADLPPIIKRQRRRLELLLRSAPDSSCAPPTRNRLEEDLKDLRMIRGAAARDAELIAASAWIAGLKLEQYADTRNRAMRLGNVEAARHLQRSLNAVGGSNLRLLRLAHRSNYPAARRSLGDTIADVSDLIGFSAPTFAAESAWS